jgi:hypothetical protein
MANFTLTALLDASPETLEWFGLLGCFLSDLLAIFEKFHANPITPQNTFALETELANGCRENCQRLLDHSYNQVKPATFEDCPVRMKLGGEEYKRRRPTPNTIATLFGPITLLRYPYEALEPGEPCIFPLELQLGIEAGLATPALAERVGLETADRPQQQVLEILQRDRGISWSVESLRKVTASLSSGLSSFREPAQVEKILELLKKADQSKGRHRPTLVVGRDGIMVPMRHGAYQEGSTATVSVMDRRGKRVGTVYVGQMPQSGQGTLSDQLTSLLAQVLLQWQGCSLRYVYVTDGGYHPQEYYKEVLQKMDDPRRPGHRLEWQWIVDFWHACCYLTKLREALFGDTPAGWKWFQRVRHWLRHRKHGITEILRSATQLWNLAKNLTETREKLFAEGYNYLRKYARRMAYSRYRRQGKPIGSGITEAACKTLFTQRLKQSGMSWTVVGGQVILDLRVLKLSGIASKTFQKYLQSKALPKSIESRSYQSRRGKILKKAA